MRLPKRSASTSITRPIVAGRRGPESGNTSYACVAAHAPKKMPQPKAAAPSTRFKSTRAGSTQVGRRIVARTALERLVDHLLLVAQAHRDVAPRLQVVVDLHGAEIHRDVVPVLVVLLGRAPQLAAPVVLVGHRGRPAVLVDEEGALGIDVA